MEDFKKKLEEYRYRLYKFRMPKKLVPGTFAGYASQVAPYTHFISTTPHELGHAMAAEILGMNSTIKIYPYGAYGGETELPPSISTLSEYELSFLCGAGPAANLVMAGIFGYIAKSIDGEKHPGLKGFFGGLSLYNGIYPSFVSIYSVLDPQIPTDFSMLHSLGSVGLAVSSCLLVAGLFITSQLYSSIYKEDPTIKEELVKSLFLARSISKKQAKEELEKQKNIAIEDLRSRLNPKVPLPKITRLKAYIKRQDPFNTLAQELYADIGEMKLELTKRGNYRIKKEDVKKVARKYHLSQKSIYDYLKKYKILEKINSLDFSD